MYVLFAVLSMLGHAFQTSLMAKYYRKLDPLAATTARGLSLGITMVPVLLLAAPGTLGRLGEQVIPLFFASLLSALGNWTAAKSFRYLPVGIAIAAQQGFLVICMTLIGIVCFSEMLGPVEWLAVALIVLANSCMGLKRSETGFRFEKDTIRGFLLCVLFGAFLAGGMSLIAKVSRELDPFVAGYIWEFSIGIIALAVLSGRARIQSMAIPDISTRDFWKILLCASPTVMGTACYALAVTTGPIAVVAAIVSTMAVMATLIGFLVYKEKPTRIQLAAIGGVVGAIGLLRLWGGS